MRLLPEFEHNPKREKEHYRCKDGGRPFISHHEMTCRDRQQGQAHVYPGNGHRGNQPILKMSIAQGLKVLKPAQYTIRPKLSHYDCLEIDELWTSVGKKENQVRLI
jgi:hypothetical protein